MNVIDKQVVIVLPIYQVNLSAFEKTSLFYCKKHLSEYDIVVIAPQSLSIDIQFLSFIETEGLSVVYFDNRFFGGIKGYNQLMLDKKFYKKFSNYSYMLIYQLDALVMSNKLSSWIDKGYDYIGAPWLSNDDKLMFDSLGNGGLSLRKIEKFIQVLESKKYYFSESKYFTTPYRASIKAMLVIRVLKWCKKHYIPCNYLKVFLFLFRGYEDRFWSFFSKFFVEEFRLPGIEESLHFSFENNPSFCFQKNNKCLPFGTHAWYKYDLNFWIENVDGLKEKIEFYQEES